MTRPSTGSWIGMHRLCGRSTHPRVEVGKRPFGSVRGASRCLFVVSVLFGILGAPPVRARARPAVSAAVKLKVVRLAREGKQAFARKDYAAAARHWREAYGLWPRPQLLYNIALAHDKLGQPVQSLTFLREFGREAASARVPKAILRAAEALERELAPRTAILNVAAPEGARLSVDGVLAGVVPLEVVVLPGRRVLLLSMSGRQEVRREVELAPGRTTRMELEMPAAVPVGPPRPEPPRPERRAPSWRNLHVAYFAGSAGLALVLAAAAVGTGMKAIDSYDRYQAAPTLANRDQVVCLRDATNSLWALAGIAGAAAVVVGVFTRWRLGRSDESALADPPRLELRPEGLGLSLTGAF